MQTGRTPKATPITTDVSARDALAEVHRRLSSIHYTLAAGDGDVTTRALDKIDALLREIDAALRS
jgi:hypothetical protein